MNKMTAHGMLAYALQHPYEGSQEIKSYQLTENGVTMTLYVDTTWVGHLSFAARYSLSHEEYNQLVANLNLMNCRYYTTEFIKGFTVLRYRFELALPEIAINSSQPNLPVPAKKSKEKLYWAELKDDQCHICHRELVDPLSLKVKIGIVCRKRIEVSEGRTSEMWENITRAELEKFWTHYNTHQQKYIQRQAERNALTESPRHPEPVNSPKRPARRYPSFLPVKPVIKPNSLPPLADLPEANCMFCGQTTRKYWYYDGKTGLCKCRDCLHRNTS